MVASSLSDPLQLPSLSNFESHFVLRALGRANASDVSLGLVRRHWSYITDLGATTTWERFDPEWQDVGALHVDGPPANSMNDRTSMAHPWAAGATTYLSEYVLGIRATSPGFQTWQAMPQLLGPPADGRLAFVRGRVPVPGGSFAGIEVDLEKGKYHVEVPAGTEARVGLPILRSGVKAVFLVAAQGESLLREELLWVNESAFGTDERPGTTVAHLRGFRAGADGDFLVISGLAGPAEGSPTTFKFRFEHVGDELKAGATSRRDIAAFRSALPVKFLGVDTDTAGHWVGSYGQAGYSLFNYSSTSREDVASLPPWAAGIWAVSHEVSTDQFYPQGNARIACPDPWNPDLVGLGAGAPVGPYQCVWIWDDIVDDARIPEPPTGTGAQQGLASAVRAKHWGGSFHVDVEFNASASAPSHVDISLYLVDYRKWSASAVVKVLDLETKRLVGPAAAVTPDAYNKGAYVRYRYPTALGRGLRFRIEQVHSAVGDRHSVRSLGYPPQTMMSAVFLDAPKDEAIAI